MKKPLVILLIALIVALWALFRWWVSPVDIISGRERIVGQEPLPDGGRLEVYQYWNSGDFYNLDLRYVARDGKQYDGVIDPDCFRIPRCRIDLDTDRSEARISAGKSIEARYRWDTRDLVRKNGVVIRCEPTN